MTSAITPHSRAGIPKSISVDDSKSRYVVPERFHTAIEEMGF